jgi:hypothetical protein
MKWQTGINQIMIGMKKQMSKFKQDLQKGHDAEIRFNALFPSWKRLDGLKADFELPNGDTVELKSEQRTTAQTPNLAVEWASSPGKPGAIERAYLDNVTYIVYLYADDNYFMFKTGDLWAFIKRNYPNYRKVKVENVNYDTEVCLIPRVDVAHLLVQIKE